jgi:hypothetical protein
LVRQTALFAHIHSLNHYEREVVDKEEKIFDWTVETPISEVIGGAVGAASLCWERPDQAGTFDSDRAARITGEVLEIIHRKTMRIR